MPGETVGDYVLLEEIGRGAMGRVFRARHAKTGAVRAVKLVSGRPDPEVLLRFRREAELLARAGRNGIVPVHEAGTDSGRLYFAMGLMPKGSLKARLAERGRFEWREAVQLVASLARTLERCHAAGLVHRDLKPDNVLFDEEDRPCLADFGCARDLMAASLTESGTMLGTPAYAAPEQLDGAKVDARADVFSLGVILCELVTGKRPFGGSSIFEQLASKLGSRPPSAHEEAGAPEAVDWVLERALAPKPDARHASAAELASDLERLLAGETPRRRPRRRIWPLALAGGAVVACGTLLASRVFPGAPARPGSGTDPALFASKPVAAIDTRAAAIATISSRIEIQTRRYRDSLPVEEKRAIVGEGIAAYRELLALDPGHAPPPQLLDAAVRFVMSYKEKHDEDEIRALEVAILQQPDLGVRLANAADQAWDIRRHDKRPKKDGLPFARARAAAEWAVEHGPADDGRVLYHLGHLLVTGLDGGEVPRSEANLEAAAAVFRRAHELLERMEREEGRRFRTRLELARLEARLGNLERALEVCPPSDLSTLRADDWWMGELVIRLRGAVLARMGADSAAVLSEIDNYGRLHEAFRRLRVADLDQVKRVEEEYAKYREFLADRARNMKTPANRVDLIRCLDAYILPE